MWPDADQGGCIVALLHSSVAFQGRWSRLHSDLPSHTSATLTSMSKWRKESSAPRKLTECYPPSVRQHFQDGASSSVASQRAGATDISARLHCRRHQQSSQHSAELIFPAFSPSHSSDKLKAQADTTICNRKRGESISLICNWGHWAY